SCGMSDGTATVVATGGTGSYTYSWDDASTQTTATATGLGQGNYNVEVVSGACNVSSSVAVDEIGAPTVTVIADETNICNGSSTTLTASGATSYVWSPATGLSGTTGDLVTATPTVNTTYNVTGTTGGCSSSASVTISVTDNTVITSQPVGTTLCEGEAYTLSVSATGSNLNYQWQLDGTNIGTNNSDYVISSATISSAGAYVCIVSGDCGSVTSSSVDVLVNLATAISTQPTDQTICEGEDVSFTVVASGVNLTYQWVKDGVNVGTNANSYDITGATSANAGNYSCIVTGTCGSVTSSVVTLTVNPLPTSSFTIDSSSEPIIAFTNTSTNADSYSWDFGDGGSATVTDPTYEYASNATYTVVLEATNACGTVSSQQTVTITNIGLVALGKEGISIYPNPVDQTLNINLPDVNVEMALVSIDGKVLKRFKSENRKHIELPMEDLAAGTYSLVITMPDKQVETVKIVKK
ncbi:MAG: immunoglobulin domain-containing protein, partial [Bacteroidales bacterium]|nr:immunoglobulin domain-containing protein [Bacteroidales bacterium]